MPVGAFLAVSAFPPYIRPRTFNAISVIFLEEDPDQLSAVTTPRPRKKLKSPFSNLKQLFSPRPLKKRRPRGKPAIRRPTKKRKPTRRPRRPPSRQRPPPPRRRPRRAVSRWRRFSLSNYLDEARNTFYRFQARTRRLRKQIAWYAGLKVRTWHGFQEYSLNLMKSPLSGQQRRGGKLRGEGLVAQEPLEESEPGRSDGEGEERGSENVRGRRRRGSPASGSQRHAVEAALRQNTKRPGTGLFTAAAADCPR